MENNIYPKLKSNPFFGSNIKKLKGKFEGYYRCIVGNYRLFYLIKEDNELVIIVSFKHGQKAYK